MVKCLCTVFGIFVCASSAMGQSQPIGQAPSKPTPYVSSAGVVQPQKPSIQLLPANAGTPIGATAPVVSTQPRLPTAVGVVQPSVTGNPSVGSATPSDNNPFKAGFRREYTPNVAAGLPRFGHVLGQGAGVEPPKDKPIVMGKQSDGRVFLGVIDKKAMYRTQEGSYVYEEIEFKK